MSFFTTILAALRWRAGDAPVVTVPALTYRAIVDTKRALRAQSDISTTHRAQVNTNVTHRAVVEAL